MSFEIKYLFMTTERIRGDMRFSMMGENIMVFNFNTEKGVEVDTQPNVLSMPIEKITLMQTPINLSPERVFFVGTEEKLFFFPEGRSAIVTKQLAEAGFAFQNMKAFGLVCINETEDGKRIRLNTKININSPAGNNIGGTKAAEYLESAREQLQDYFVID